MKNNIHQKLTYKELGVRALLGPISSCTVKTSMVTSVYSKPKSPPHKCSALNNTPRTSHNLRGAPSHQPSMMASWNSLPL